MNGFERIGTLALVLGSVTLARAAGTSITSMAWDERPWDVRDKDGASSWWASSWHTGDSVRMSTQYSLEAVMRIFEKDMSKVRWFNLKRRFGEADYRFIVEGSSRTVTNVLRGDKDLELSGAEVQLHRNFECPMSARGAAVVGIRGMLGAESRLRQTYNSFYEWANSPSVQNVFSFIVKGGQCFAQLMAAKNGDASGQGVDWGSVQNKFELANAFNGGVQAAFASPTCQRWYENSLKRLNDADFQNGGIEARVSSPFYKKIESKELKEATNFAEQFNDLFTGKDFYLSTKVGGVVFAKQLVRNGTAWNTLVEAKDLSEVPAKMAALPVSAADKKVASVFARETLNVNAKLFDSRQRKVKDVWVTQADLLNNYLHPDLAGSFSGNIIMEYAEDVEVTLKAAGIAEKQDYQVRHLRMKPTDTGLFTEFSYEEPGDCKFTYSAKDKNTTATIDIYVDKDTGYVVKVDAEMKGTVEALPNMALTKGWSFSNGEGTITMRIHAECVPSRLLTK